MSVSTASYESIWRIVKHFDNSELPITYTSNYINLICEILCLILGEKKIEYILCLSVLQEPLTFNRGLVHISIPLIAQLINAPVKFAPKEIKIIDQFDIFAELNRTYKEEKKTKKELHLACIQDGTLRSRRNFIKPSFGCCIDDSDQEETPIIKNDEGDMIKKTGASAEKFGLFSAKRSKLDMRTESDEVRIIILLRIVIMCAHFKEHVANKTPFDNHRNFKKIEVAVRK